MLPPAAVVVGFGVRDHTRRMQRHDGGSRLTAVLFTDIVRSTQIAAEIGDTRWRELITRHHSLVSRQLKRFGGRLNDTAGDGVFATFERPADAIRCACACVVAVRELGIEIRAGVNFGETEPIGGKLGGIAVHIGARVMSVAGPGEVLVPAATKDLVPGSGFGFVEHGIHQLKGVEGEQRLFLVVSVDGELVPEPADPATARERLAEVEPSLAVTRRSKAVIVGSVLLLAVISVAVVAKLSRGDPEVEPAGVRRSLIGIDPVTMRPEAPVAGLTYGRPDFGGCDHLLEAGAGGVWTVLGGPHSLDRTGLQKVDPSSGSVVATASQPQLGVANSCALQIAQDRGWHVWFLQDSQLFGLDASTAETVVSRRIESLSLGITSNDASVLDGVIWAGGGTSLVRIDQVSLEESVFEPGLTVDELEAGEGELFALDLAAGRLVRLSQENGRILAEVAVDVSRPVLRVGEGYVWVLDRDTGIVQKFSPDDLAARSSIALDEDTIDMAAGFGAAWVTDAGGAVYRIDAITGDVTRIAFDGPVFAVAIDAELERVWVLVD